MSGKDRDELKVSSGVPKFGPKPEAGPSNDNSKADSKAAIPAAFVVNEPIADKAVEAIAAMPKLRVLRGGGAEIHRLHPQAAVVTESVAVASKTEKSLEANVGVSKDGVNANVGMSYKKTTEVGADMSSKVGLDDEQFKEAFMDALKEQGIDVSKSGKISLEVVSKVLHEMMGDQAPDASKLDEKAREKMLGSLAKQLGLRLRQEKGTEVRAGLSVGNNNAQGGGGAAAPADGAARGGSNVGAELVTASASLIGGIASLATGSAKFLGSAVGAAGRSIGSLGAGRSGKPGFAASSYDNISVLPTISEYRVKQIDKAADGYEAALSKFWKIEPMAALRSEIEERARTTGISVPDAMAKMKPGGEWGDLHDKFVQEVAGSREALQGKVALDNSLKSFVRQIDHGAEELMNADMDNPAHAKARKRIDAAKERMEGLSGETPVFAGETESHAERLKAALQAIVDRIKEILQAVGVKFSGGGAEHATP